MTKDGKTGKYARELGFVMNVKSKIVNMERRNYK